MIASKLIDYYGLNNLMDRDGIIESLRIIAYRFYNNDPSKIRSTVTSLLRTIFQLQFEMRGLIIDFELINKLSSSFYVDTDHNIILLEEWRHVDKHLHNWICPKCDAKVYGIPHPSQECELNLVSVILVS